MYIAHFYISFETAIDQLLFWNHHKKRKLYLLNENTYIYVLIRNKKN